VLVHGDSAEDTLSTYKRRDQGRVSEGQSRAFWLSGFTRFNPWFSSPETQYRLKRPYRDAVLHHPTLSPGPDCDGCYPTKLCSRREAHGCGTACP
jgi:hypothetical protein